MSMNGWNDRLSLTILIQYLFCVLHYHLSPVAYDAMPQLRTPNLVRFEQDHYNMASLSTTYTLSMPSLVDDRLLVISTRTGGRTCITMTILCCNIKCTTPLECIIQYTGFYTADRHMRCTHLFISYCLSREKKHFVYTQTCVVLYIHRMKRSTSYVIDIPKVNARSVPYTWH